EHRVISALAGTAIPVPVAIDLVDDTDGPITGTPFFLMEKAPGKVVVDRAQNAAYAREEIRGMSFELVHHLAALHSVDVNAVGLASFGK
ncbi:phosphotransferase, partial [Escherichia coli]|nr:phosphotransferase [Escherichia coli]